MKTATPLIDFAPLIVSIVASFGVLLLKGHVLPQIARIGAGDTGGDSGPSRKVSKRGESTPTPPRAATSALVPTTRSRTRKREGGDDNPDTREKITESLNAVDVAGRGDCFYLAALYVIPNDCWNVLGGKAGLPPIPGVEKNENSPKRVRWLRKLVSRNMVGSETAHESIKSLLDLRDNGEAETALLFIAEQEGTILETPSLKDLIEMDPGPERNDAKILVLTEFSKAILPLRTKWACQIEKGIITRLLSQHCKIILTILQTNRQGVMDHGGAEKTDKQVVAQMRDQLQYERTRRKNDEYRSKFALLLNVNNIHWKAMSNDEGETVFNITDGSLNSPIRA